MKKEYDFSKAKRGGGSYQTLINDALREYVQNREGVLEKTLRRVIHEELRELKRLQDCL